jgi:16S rRNA (guanine527-N7)-methyltransferase
LASGQSLVDIGTGAGFPGLPIKIVHPQMQLALLVTTRKKAAFLRNLVAVLGLEGVDVLEGRAEELGRTPQKRQGYDYGVARAVAELRVLVELALPLLKVSGVFIAYKGVDVAEELRLAETALDTLRGRLLEVRPVDLPGLEPRHLIVIEKIGPTPDRYPRRPGIPAKRPLG